MVIRFAKENELIRVNELRKQVNDLHVEGKSEVFKAGLYQSVVINTFIFFLPSVYFL